MTVKVADPKPRIRTQSEGTYLYQFSGEIQKICIESGYKRSNCLWMRHKSFDAKPDLRHNFWS